VSANPFDVRTVFLAKHARHVALIHFPIALLNAAVAFDYLAQGTKSRTLAAAVSTVLIWHAFWVHWRARRNPERPLPSYRLPIEAVGVIFVGLTAHLGGFLSGVSVPGRTRSVQPGM
jgi:uncharacterized membrane protein